MLVVAAGCKDRAPDAAAAARELRALERILAEVSSTEIHPRLQDADLAPLRSFKPTDERVLRVRETCLRQYEEIARTYRDLDRCADLERTLAGFLRGPVPDAGDPAAVLDEAQQVCGRAFRSTDRVEQARAACDRRISGLREGLGL